MTRRPHLRAALAGLAALTLAGCGDRSAAGAGDEPVTPRALAAVAEETTGEPSRADNDGETLESLGRDQVFVAMSFGAGGEYDGDLLEIAVGRDPVRDLTGCGGRVRHCVETDDGVLQWFTHIPEEDPGGVRVVVTKGEATVVVQQSGPTITGDPRELDIPISVEDMFAIATDPRVDLTTSDEAIEAGEDISYWRG